MSQSSSETDLESISENNSECDFEQDSVFAIESELDFEREAANDNELLSGVEPYSREPLADENWLDEYNKRQQEKQQKLQLLSDRLNGKETISNW